MSDKKVHLGHNIKRIRELLEIKQDTLADTLGSDWSQKKVSLLEGKEEIDDELLQQVAKALNVPVEAIKNFNEQAAIYNIQNNHQGANVGANSVTFGTQHCHFNPLEKYVEAIEKNEKLYNALLKEKDEKIALMNQMINGKK